MTADVTSENPKRKLPASLHSRSWEMGKSAFKLMAKHRTPADPLSYAVWYEYALNQNTELVSAMDAILEHDRGISSAEIRQLHEAYLLETNETEERLQGISEEIETKMAGAQSLVSEAISNTNDYVSTMGDAQSRLPQASTPEEIMRALDEIVDHAKTSQESAETIHVALKSTQEEMTQLSARVGQLRENLKRDSLTNLVNRDRFETLLAEGSADAFANGYSLTVMVVSVKNIQDLCLTADLDISEFIVKSVSGILTSTVGDRGTCARLSGSDLAIMLPKSVYADASQVAKKIIAELDQFKIVKKPSEKLVGYIQCAFGGSALKAGLSPSDLIRIAGEQAAQAKFANKNHVKFDLANHQAA